MRTTQRDLVDRVTGGRLDDILNDSASYMVARDLLMSEYDVKVSAETLRRWHAAPEKAAS